MPLDTEVAWAAGFFDGEGCSHATYSWTRKDGTKGYAIQVSLGQSGEEGRIILERWNDTTGRLGNINGPYGPYGLSKKVVYQLQINGYDNVKKIYTLLEPWLSEPKIAQFNTTLDLWLKSKRG